MIWTVWWAWIAGGFVIGALEVVLPGYIFLGFAIGAVMTGILLGFGVLTGASLSTLLMVFALASLGAWAALRYGLGRHPGQVKIWDRDINE
jgi:membrane protein implicated in regulation of membrane protease activity